MAQLKWDQIGEKYYETGTKNGVLYRKNSSGTAYEKGVAWNGLTAVTESPSGAEETALYADDVKYLSLYSAEQFGGTIEAYTYPDEWMVCDGSAELSTGIYVGQQSRRGFGFSYVTTKGNDGQGNDYGEKLHIVYNAMASPSERSYSTINDSPEAITFSWTFTTTPIDMPNSLKKSAILTIDSTKIDSAVYAAIKAKLYGDATHDPVLPTPAELLALISGSTPSYTYTQVSSASEGYADKSPRDEGWFEMIDDTSGSELYVLSNDDYVDVNTKYYTRSLSE